MQPASHRDCHTRAFEGSISAGFRTCYVEKATKASRFRRCQCACGYDHFITHTYVHTSRGVEALENEDAEARIWCVAGDNPPAPPPGPDLMLTQWGKAG